MEDHQPPQVESHIPEMHRLRAHRARPELRRPRLRSRLCRRGIRALETTCCSCCGAREGILRLSEEGSAGLEDGPRGAEEGSCCGHVGGWGDHEDESVT
jgi:hypothetical protein